MWERQLLLAGLQILLPRYGHSGALGVHGAGLVPIPLHACPTEPPAHENLPIPSELREARGGLQLSGAWQ